MKPTIEQVRQAFDPLTGRELAHLLQTWQVGVNERKVRAIMAGKEQCPLVLYRAALHLQNELDKLPDRDFETLITETRTQMR